MSFQPARLTIFIVFLFINTAYNRLSGTIPREIEKTELTQLELQNNQLTGEIPRLPQSLIFCNICELPYWYHGKDAVDSLTLFLCLSCSFSKRFVLAFNNLVEIWDTGVCEVWTFLLNLATHAITTLIVVHMSANSSVNLWSTVSSRPSDSNLGWPKMDVHGAIHTFPRENLCGRWMDLFHSPPLAISELLYPQGLLVSYRIPKGDGLNKGQTVRYDPFACIM